MLVIVAGLGLLVAAVVSTAQLRSFVLRRVDDQLESFGRRRFNSVGRAPRFTCQAGPFVYQGIVLELYRTDGTLICAPQSSIAPGGGPRIDPSHLQTASTTPFNAPARNGVGHYRVVTRTTDEGVVALGLSLSEADATWKRLVVVEVVVVATVMVALGLLAHWLVRASLRPLDHMAETADRIAEGDLSQRVDDDDTRTEVGRLGHAFNTMVEAIEAAFAQRQQSEDRLRRFVADASHELRTPLTSIRGYAELYRRGAAEEPEELALILRRIEEESERMAVLVEDLMLLARLDQGRPLEQAHLSLSRVVADAVADARAVQPERPISLDDPPDVEVVGDEGRLRQVVGNLLANALTHTPAETPVDLTLERRGDMCRLAVIDHGVGIPPADVDRMFERFARLDTSRARKQKPGVSPSRAVRGGGTGTGLGLPIARAIVNAHHGELRHEPTPGGGTTFVVILPLPTEEGPWPSPPPATAADTPVDRMELSSGPPAS
jgi:two-component system OmpR family sensor kinase